MHPDTLDEVEATLRARLGAVLSVDVRRHRRAARSSPRCSPTGRPGAGARDAAGRRGVRTRRSPRRSGPRCSPSTTCSALEARAIQALLKSVETRDLATALQGAEGGGQPACSATCPSGPARPCWRRSTDAQRPGRRRHRGAAQHRRHGAARSRRRAWSLTRRATRTRLGDERARRQPGRARRCRPAVGAPQADAARSRPRVSARPSGRPAGRRPGRGARRRGRRDAGRGARRPPCGPPRPWRRSPSWQPERARGDRHQPRRGRAGLLVARGCCAASCRARATTCSPGWTRRHRAAAQPAPPGIAVSPADEPLVAEWAAGRGRVGTQVVADARLAPGDAVVTTDAGTGRGHPRRRPAHRSRGPRPGRPRGRTSMTAETSPVSRPQWPALSPVRVHRPDQPGRRPGGRGPRAARARSATSSPSRWRTATCPPRWSP